MSSMSSQPPSRSRTSSLFKKVKATLPSSTRKKTSSKEVKPAVVLSDTSSQQVYIRIRRADLQDIKQPTASGHVYLIQGSFQDISQYSGTTVDWVIKVAHLMCDPLGAGQIFTHTSGVPNDWYNIDRNSTWKEVAYGELLLPNIYEFSPTQPITLSRMSARTTRSVTTTGSQSQSNASMFCHLLIERDALCVVTHSGPTIASHLIPRRLGDDGVRDVIGHFVSAAEAAGAHQYDPQIGIALCSHLDHWVDIFQVGFYHVTNNTYTLHNFNGNQPNMNIMGQNLPVGLLPEMNIPPLHGFSVTLSVHAGNQPLPPPGVFNWHYLQCVIQRFGTSQYKALSNIFYFVHSFRTASDMDDENPGGFDDMNPPYPTYYFDQLLQQQSDHFWALEHHQEVLQWASGIPSGNPDEEI